MALSQEPRTLNITTPLGDNELLLTAFEGTEEISGLFEFELELISDNNNISPADIVGHNVTFSTKLTDQSPRFFNGFVRRFQAEDEDREGRRNYRAQVVPWLWFLTRTADCRIFQEKTVPEIIEEIFGDLGFTDFNINVSGNHPTREYCVQYRETDFNFVSRLMQEEGIFYFFKHEDGKHTMEIADKSTAFQNCPESEVDYPVDTGHVAIDDHITSWTHRYEYRTGKYAQTDYNFKTPSTKLMTNTGTLVSLKENSKYEIYDYPGLYTNSGDGQPLTDTRMEEQEVEYDVVDATSLCKTFTPGGKFKIGQHKSSSEEGKTHVITSITHKAAEPYGYETAYDVDEDYSNSFTCIPDSVNYRPARVNEKPTVRGVQTAVVVGPGGEEIYTDEYGRVKVQFFWDRVGKNDENSSCWIRVSQNWAGQNWGIIFNPRIGQEVIVDFIEGDPDRPIITGRVYNAEQMPPYELPGEQTKSTIKTRSSKGGGPDNFNEIRFEDKMGSEEIYVHAEKDQNIVVENDRSETIGRDRSLLVGRDKSEQVDRNKSIKVAQNHTEQIGQAMSIMVGTSLTETVTLNYVETVGAAMTLNVGAALSISCGAAMAENIGGAKSESIGGSKAQTIGSNKAVVIGKSLTETIKENKTIEISKDLNEKIAGEHREEVAKDYMVTAKKMQFTADDQITFKTGKAEIIMKKNGDITIKGKKVNVKASGNIVMKGSKILEN